MDKETITFIQWKGTDLCMDFYCPSCTEHSHFDCTHAYYIQCPYCESVFKMPTNITPEKVDKSEKHFPIIKGEKDDR